MSDRLPVVNSKQLVEFFQHHGFTVDRKKGDHTIMMKSGVNRPLVIPYDPKEVKTMEIRCNLKTAGIGREEFARYFRKSKPQNRR